jgi:hypothetical protein
MRATIKSHKATIALLSSLSLAIFATAANATELTAFVLMPANTFGEGPTSEQFATGAGGNPLPLIDKQPVQGILAVLQGLPPIPSM